jgi:hypothetical protein
MKPILNNSGGMCAAFPDTCKTPSPGGPVPMPYPNMAQDGDGDGLSSVKIENKNVLRKGDHIRMSSGDEAGSIGGIMSGVFKNSAEIADGCSTVTAEGMPVAYLLVGVEQNGGGSNAKGGKAVQPPQTSVLIEKTNAQGEKFWDKQKPYVDDGKDVPPDKKADDAAGKRSRARSREGRRVASQEMGEEGARNYINQEAANHGGLDGGIFEGQGPGVFDFVAKFKDGVAMIVEAKGGGAGRCLRTVGDTAFRQGTPNYKDAIVEKMQTKGGETGDVGDMLADSKDVKYVEVKTKVKNRKASTKAREYDPPPDSGAEPLSISI